MQMCSDPALMLCSTALGKVQFLLRSVGLQHRLRACLRHCNYTYEGLVFMQCNPLQVPESLQEWLLFDFDLDGRHRQRQSTAPLTCGFSFAEAKQVAVPLADSWT